MVSPTPQSAWLGAVGSSLGSFWFSLLCIGLEFVCNVMGFGYLKSFAFFTTPPRLKWWLYLARDIPVQRASLFFRQVWASSQGPGTMKVCCFCNCCSFLHSQILVCQLRWWLSPAVLLACGEEQTMQQFGTAREKCSGEMISHLLQATKAHSVDRQDGSAVKRWWFDPADR